MTNFELIKLEIAKCDSPMELLGYLDGVQAAAIMHCKDNCPDELHTTSSGATGISILGFANYLESEERNEV